MMNVHELIKLKVTITTNQRFGTKKHSFHTTKSGQLG